MFNTHIENTIIDGVTFGRSEFIALLTQVIEALKGYEAAREIEIEEFMGPHERHEGTLRSLMFDYYKYCCDWEFHEGRRGGSIPGFARRKQFICYILPNKTVVGEPKHTIETFSEEPIQQSWWETLLGKPVKYRTVSHFEEVEGTQETITESIEDFWIRLDEALKTPEFDRLSDKVVFYIDKLVHSWVYNIYERGTKNYITPIREGVEADLKRILAAPDAEYHVDGEKFKAYTKYTSGEYKLSEYYT